MKRRAATAALLLTAASALSAAPGLYVQRGVRGTTYYGSVTAVDLRTLEIIPYDPRPAAPLPDPARLMSDLETARRISIERGLTRPEPPPRRGGALLLGASCALSLAIAVLYLRHASPAAWP